MHQFLPVEHSCTGSSGGRALLAFRHVEIVPRRSCTDYKPTNMCGQNEPYHCTEPDFRYLRAPYTSGTAPACHIVQVAPTISLRGWLLSLYATACCRRRPACAHSGTAQPPLGLQMCTTLYFVGMNASVLPSVFANIYEKRPDEFVRENASSAASYDRTYPR